MFHSVVPRWLRIVARATSTGVGGRPVSVPCCAAVDELERLLDEPQRLLGVADEARDRGAQPQRLGLARATSLASRAYCSAGATARSAAGRLADVDVELRERAVRGRELARLADRLGLLAQRVELAQLLRRAWRAGAGSPRAAGAR